MVGIEIELLPEATTPTKIEAASFIYIVLQLVGEGASTEGVSA